MNTRPIIGANELVGVEARAGEGDAWRFRWVHLRKGRSGVRIMRSGEVDGNAEALAAAFGPRYPVALAVLHERILLRSTGQPFIIERDLQQWLPNVQRNDLLVDAYRLDQSSLVAIARRSLVDGLLDALGGAGIRPVALALGPWVCASMRVHWSTAGPAASWGPHHFSTGAQGAWTHEERTTVSGTIPLGDEELDARWACAMAAAWQHWFAPVAQEITPHPGIQHARSEERARLLYERASLAVVVILLLVLGTDLLLRRTIARERDGLNEVLAERTMQQAELDTLRDRMTAREQLLATGGFAHAGRNMQVLDALASSVPAGIRLSEIWLAPLSKPLRAEEAPQRRPGILSMAGTVRDPALLPAWTARLKAMEHVNGARLISLRSDAQAPAPVFHLEIDLP